MSEWVFGYGSLVTDLAELSATEEASWRWADLLKHRRDWGVGMENANRDADPKHYVDASGSRPDIVVAFLDVYLHPGARTNGIIFPANRQKIAVLDQRELRYDRVDVTELITNAPGADFDRVWTYRGTPRAREVTRQGKEHERAFVSRAYVDHCSRGFALGGNRTVRDFESSTDPLDLPLRELTLVRNDGG